MHLEQAISRNEQVMLGEDETATSNGRHVETVSQDGDTDVMAKYAEERDKRLREDGESQFVQLHKSSKFKYMTYDPWLPANGAVTGFKLSQDDQLHFKFVLKGAGYAGLLYAARLIEAGYSPDDIVLVDYASGFGGTWYWNRYPGLMCDVAAEVYMPLLEETGYIPIMKYASGSELREHADRIAKTYGLSERAIFRATIEDAIWNERKSAWELNVVQEQGPKQGEEATKARTVVSGDYVFSLSGVLNYPKLPNLPGMESFRGHQFHTSRWDYNYTGGSETNFDLHNLKDKRVALVGTGATAVQVVPQLARWAKQLYVAQRTPSAVDVRGQIPIDRQEFEAKIANTRGWQQSERENMAAFVSDVSPKPMKNMVNDQWTTIPTYAALVGGPNDVDFRKTQSITEHVERLYKTDLFRQDRIRTRVREVVRDPSTAKRLQPWYPSWCKRPCFHDQYLPAFNQDNVALLDTEGRGIDRLTSDGIVVRGEEVKIDVLIWASGFTLGGGADSLGQYVVRGRNGLSMSQKIEKGGYATLHGAVTRDFPNFFLPGPSQAGATANQVHMIELVCEHTIHMIKSAERRGCGKKVLIEPTLAAEEDWANRVAASAVAMAAVQGCTPGYINREGTRSNEDMPLEEKMKAARMATWGKGILDYARILKEWRADDNMNDLDITVC